MISCHVNNPRLYVSEYVGTLVMSWELSDMIALLVQATLPCDASMSVSASNYLSCCHDVENSRIASHKKLPEPPSQIMNQYGRLLGRGCDRRTSMRFHMP